MTEDSFAQKCLLFASDYCTYSAVLSHINQPVAWPWHEKKSHSFNSLFFQWKAKLIKLNQTKPQSQFYKTGLSQIYQIWTTRKFSSVYLAYVYGVYVQLMRKFSIHPKGNRDCFASLVCLCRQEKTQTIQNRTHQQHQQAAMPCCSFFVLATRTCSPHNILLMYKSVEAVTIMATAPDVLGCGFRLICRLVGGNFFLFNRLMKNESITAFLREDSHFRWVDGHLSSRVWRQRLADPARNQKPNRFKVLALSFNVCVCVYLCLWVWEM